MQQCAAFLLQQRLLLADIHEVSNATFPHRDQRNGNMTSEHEEKKKQCNTRGSTGTGGSVIMLA